MRCLEAHHRLSAYHDDELSAAVRTAVSMHLQICRECKRELLSFERITKLATTIRDIEPPQQQWLAIRDKLSRPWGAGQAPGFALTTYSLDPSQGRERRRPTPRI